MNKKRLLGCFLAVCMIFQAAAICPSYAADSASGRVIANLTGISFINSCGLVPNSRYTLSSDLSAEWSGNSLSSEIIIPVTSGEADGFLEFPVFSKLATGMPFAVVILSDNPATSGKDYYYIKLSASWQGWKTVSARLEPLSGKAAANDEDMSWEEFEAYDLIYGKDKLYPQFETKGSPLPIDSIEEIRLWPNYESTDSFAGTALCFDVFMITDNRSESAARSSEVCRDTNIPRLTLKDFSDSSQVPKGLEYSTNQSKSGVGSAKLAAPNLSGSVAMKVESDWTGYNCFNIDVYSEKATGSKFHLVVVSDNPATDGSDYWSSWITLDWAGSWQTFSFNFDASNNQTDFKKDRSPLSFTKVTSLAIWKSSGGNVISDDTVAYIGDIYLTYTDSSRLEDYAAPEADYANIDLDIVDRLKSTVDRKEHPRVFTTSEQLAKTKELLAGGDKFLTDTYDRVKAKTDSYLTQPPSQHGLADGVRLDKSCTDVLRNLAVISAVSDEAKYLERLWLELESVVNWPNWNTTHFLDVGEVSQAVAVAYDLCYEFFTPQQRKTICRGLVKNGIAPSVRLWRNGRGNYTNNWQQVIAGGVGTAALAIIDEPEYTDLCAEYICHTMDTLPAGLGEYAPDGMMPEGVGYWIYATQYFVPYDIALFNCLGTDYGLAELPGVSQNAYFPIISKGPSGAIFNFSDASASTGGIDPSMLLTAKHYNQSEIAAYFISKSGGNAWWNTILWYTDEYDGIDYREKMPLDVHYRPNTDFSETNDVVYTRASWYDKNSAWLAYKGRLGNAGGHGDLDAGQFVLEMQGIRWFADLGSANYNLPGMFNVTDSTATKRWVYYRKRAEAHNTLVINPAKNTEEDQEDNSVSLITKFETSPSASYGIVDMTAAYPDTEHAIRGFALKNNRSEVVIQDEVSAKEPMEIYSFFTTAHNIELTDDASVAYVTADSGERIRLDIVSPAGAEWRQMACEPLSTSPHPEGDNAGSYSNNAYNKLFIHLNNVTDVTLSVLVRNVYNDITLDTPEAAKPISDWDEYFEDGATIDNLYVGGVAVEGFKPTNSHYSIECITGELSASYDPSKVSVEYRQAHKLGETASCTVTDLSNGAKRIYYVSFEDVKIDVDAGAASAVPIVSAEASGTPEPANIAANTFDGDLETRWSCDGEAWIVWELDGEYSLDSILLSFWKGGERSTKFDIYTSTDAQQWQQVFSGAASGNGENLELFEFGETVRTRYIKFCGHGNSVNTWNSILEVSVAEKLPDFADIAGHWAESEINQMRQVGLVKGISSASYCPDSEVSRAEFIAMTARCIGADTAAYGGEFADVDGSEWYADILASAKHCGIIPEEMLQDGCIFPNNPITRQEAAAVLGAVCDSAVSASLPVLPLGMFADESQISDSFVDAVSKVVGIRWMNGHTSESFAPLVTLTRAEAAVVLKRVYVWLSNNL